MLLLLMNATFLYFYYMYYLIWDDMRVAVALHKGVNEMGYIMTNITFNLYHGELEEVEHLKAALAGVKVVFS